MAEKEQEQKRPSEKAVGSKKKKLIVGGAVVVAAAAVIAFVLLNKKPEGNVMTEGNYQRIMEDMGNEVQEGYFETYMNAEWTFPDGTSETTDAILGNSPNNKKPIRCEVQLADTGEVIFSTDVIPVGAELPPFKLDKDLDAGTYEAVCMVYLLDEKEDGTYTDYSNAGFNVTITVEN